VLLEASTEFAMMRDEKEYRPWQGKEVHERGAA
jgi:hypothetical protein